MNRFIRMNNNRMLSVELVKSNFLGTDVYQSTPFSVLYFVNKNNTVVMKMKLPSTADSAVEIEDCVDEELTLVTEQERGKEMNKEITAQLTNAALTLHWSGVFVVIGTVVGDVKGRFDDGSEIRTSAVKSIEPNASGNLVVQTDNSVYEIIGTLTVNSTNTVT